jgi:hypothetical protein
MSAQDNLSADQIVRTIADAEIEIYKLTAELLRTQAERDQYKLAAEINKQTIEGMVRK